MGSPGNTLANTPSIRPPDRPVRRAPSAQGADGMVALMPAGRTGSRPQPRTARGRAAPALTRADRSATRPIACAQLANVTVTIARWSETHAQTSHRRPSDDPSPTPGATPRPAPRGLPAAAGAATTPTTTTATLGGGGSYINRLAGRIPRLARQPAGQPRRISTGGQAAGHCRARPRGDVRNRPTARLRPRLTQEVHHSITRHHGQIAELDGHNWPPPTTQLLSPQAGRGDCARGQFLRNFIAERVPAP